MSLEYYHYTKTVLGVSYVFKPYILKNFYTLYHSSDILHSKQELILFVCKTYGVKEKHLIDNMNRALVNHDLKWVLHFTHPKEQVPFQENKDESFTVAYEQKIYLQVFNNILFRFHPKYVIWFDQSFAKQIFGETLVYGKHKFEIQETTSGSAKAYPLLVLDPIQNFVDEKRGEHQIKELKKKTWETLKNLSVSHSS